MSIQRSQSPQSSENTQRSDAAEKALAKREPPPADQVERFRAVMDQLRDGADGQLSREARVAGDAAQQQADAAAGKEALRSDAVLDAQVRDAAVHRSDDPNLLASQPSATTIDASQLWQAQGALRDGDVPVQAPAPSGAANALATAVDRATLACGPALPFHTSTSERRIPIRLSSSLRWNWGCADSSR